MVVSVWVLVLFIQLISTGSFLSALQQILKLSHCAYSQCCWISFTRPKYSANLQLKPPGVATWFLTMKFCIITCSLWLFL